MAYELELIGKKIQVLDDGYVQLLDVMGDDFAVTAAARLTAQTAGTKSMAEERGLIRYLLRHAHTTPFEMVEFKLQVKCPMDVWRQWIRHRTASVNEYSTRYSEAIDSTLRTDPAAWRQQSNANRQGSSGNYVDAGTGEYLSKKELELHELSREVYKQRLAFDVAKEQARKDLPLSTYTEAVWKIDLNNLLRFLSLRMDAHAQYEIRQYANVIGNDFVAKICPMTWEAFNDFDMRREAVLLTRLDAEVIKFLTSAETGFHATEDTVLKAWEVVTGVSPSKRSRERDECVQRLRQLGLVRRSDEF
jgi:thymidylate synthase (FAD)